MSIYSHIRPCKLKRDEARSLEWRNPFPTLECAKYAPVFMQFLPTSLQEISFSSVDDNILSKFHLYSRLLSRNWQFSLIFVAQFLVEISSNGHRTCNTLQFCIYRLRVGRSCQRRFNTGVLRNCTKSTLSYNWRLHLPWNVLLWRFLPIICQCHLLISIWRCPPTDSSIVTKILLPRAFRPLFCPYSRIY